VNRSTAGSRASAANGGRCSAAKSARRIGTVERYDTAATEGVN
jgi:hypothetical protein